MSALSVIVGIFGEIVPASIAHASEDLIKRSWITECEAGLLQVLSSKESKKDARKLLQGHINTLKTHGSGVHDLCSTLRVRVKAAVDLK